MAKDAVYAGGVIAVKEKSLLKNKIEKLCALTPDEAFRSLKESGFGAGAEAASVSEYEKLLAQDLKDIDAFTREYALNNAQKAYFFAERDFHNAKAFLKASILNSDVSKMLSPDGLYAADEIKAFIFDGAGRLPRELERAIEEVKKLIEDGKATGAEVGIIFERAKFEYLLSACKSDGFLKSLIRERIDRANVLSFMRANTPEYALNTTISGGKIAAENMCELFSENAEKAASALDKTYLKDFWRKCYALKKDGKPFVDAELEAADVDVETLKKNRFELKRGQPFLYYVFRRRAENTNVRILLSCLIAEMSEREIVARLRAV